MSRRMSFCLVMPILQAITWYSSATSRSYASEFTQELRNEDGVSLGSEELRGELSSFGSRPPSCRLKCEGCVPCEAIQIPEGEIRGHVHVQYANYEPEGWKCKCGLSIFNLL